MEKDKNSTLQQLDYTLLFIIFLFLCVSIISIYTAESTNQLSGFAIKQFAWYMVGGVAIAVIMLIDFDRYRQVAWYLFIFGIITLIPLPLAHHGLLPTCENCVIVTNNGATSWYNLPGAGTIQPSEFMKIFLIIILSHIIMKHHEEYPSKTVRDDWSLLGKIIGISLIPLALVAVQPDLGTAMVLASITFSLIVVSGIRWRIIVLVTLAVVLFIGLNILLYIYFPEHAFLKSYQMDRIYSWLYPHQHENDGQAYQLLKSLNAVGSGQLFGTGLQNFNLILPEAYTDFIFAVIANEFGFLGASLVISLYFLLIYRMIHTSLEIHDRFGSYLCAGVIGMFMFQVFQNIGMTIQIMPITGIPLPFISYGGSSLITSMIAIGIVLNVRSRKRTYMFD
ncbi:MAG TPA: FtsW/RodA/SpoVE family cell cycle protein [Bacillales bacterium]|nr:FtsW/RodA/SpoVE family cell cycle protein [Bacillales bacterium]